MKVRAMERFIRGFALKSDSKFDEALTCYEKALEYLPEGGLNDNQRSQLMNEIVQCLLRIEPVNYGRAVDLGRRLYRLRETPNNIDVLLRSLLGQTYYDPSASNDVVQQNLVEMEKFEQLLRNKCEGSSLSFYAFRRIDRLEAETIHTVLAGSLPYPSLDLSAVIGSCTDAYLKYGDEALLWRKWDLMLLNEVERNWDSLHLEAAEYLRRGSKNRMGRGNAARIKILTYDLSISENIRIARVELDKFRTDGTLPQSVATDLRRQIDAGDQHNSRVLGKFVNRGLRIN
jgi:tetratricopeptide (TPR) repeat protein